MQTVSVISDKLTIVVGGKFTKGHKMSYVAGRVVLLLAATTFSIGPTFAQPDGSASRLPPVVTQPAEQPWSAGVSAAKKTRAQDLLARGNQLLIQNSHAAALELYERAAHSWNHPAIQANIVICLINLGRTLEAYESAKAALRYGAAPFDKPEVYTATRTFMKLLETQIGFVRVSCKPGVRITLDGKPLHECPIARRPLLAGRHQLVGQKDGFLTITRDFVTTGGTTDTVELPLIPLTETSRMEYRWSPTIPVAVVGSGVLTMGSGVFFQRRAARMRRQREDLKDCKDCDEEMVTQRAKRIAALRARADLWDKIAVTSIGAGAAVTVAGLLLMYINRARPVPAYDSRGIQVLPALTPDSAGVSLDITF